jgi:hypothetical protein
MTWSSQLNCPRTGSNAAQKCTPHSAHPSFAFYYASNLVVEASSSSCFGVWSAGSNPQARTTTGSFGPRWRVYIGHDFHGMYVGKISDNLIPCHFSAQVLLLHPAPEVQGPRDCGSRPLRHASQPYGHVAAGGDEVEVAAVPQRQFTGTTLRHSIASIFSWTKPGDS